jgi:hypothetical protein
VKKLHLPSVIELCHSDKEPLNSFV